MTETKPLILYSRSHVVSDWTCPRKRYWNYQYGGKGLVSNRLSMPLFLGTALHDGLAAIALGVDIDKIASAANQQVLEGLLPLMEAEVGGVDYANEQATLTEGLLRGFYQHAWPLLIKDRKIVLVEQEMTYEHDGLTFMSKPDLILEDSEGELIYVEYKSTSSKKDEWVNSWDTAIQLHSTIKAVEATVGKAPSQVIVQGLYKGYSSYGKQTSPFCYGYFRSGNPPFTQDQTLYEFKAGFKKSPVWQMEGGVKKWVEEMPAEILQNQFPQTLPIFINQEMVETFFRQRVKREREMYEATQLLTADPTRQDILDEVFPQKFEACSPAWGGKCSYKDLCFGYVPDPLSLGYTWRESHHTLEAAHHSQEG